MQVSTDENLEMLRSMLLTRRFEDSLTELCKAEGRIPGMMILCTGQAAVGSGACAAMSPEDVAISNHHSHSHLLAKGADPKTLMAEIYGKRTGCNKGKSGTLHLAVPEVNALCTTTLVGGGLPISVGVAFAHTSNLKGWRERSMKKPSGQAQESFKGVGTPVFARSNFKYSDHLEPAKECRISKEG